MCFSLLNMGIVVCIAAPKAGSGVGTSRRGRRRNRKLKVEADTSGEIAHENERENFLFTDLPIQFAMDFKVQQSTEKIGPNWRVC